MIFLGDADAPKPFGAQIHIKVQKPGPHRSVVQERGCRFFLPHEVFSYFYNKERDVFNNIMLGGGSATVPEFWQGVCERGGPRIDNHQMEGKAGTVGCNKPSL